MYQTTACSTPVVPASTDRPKPDVKCENTNETELCDSSHYHDNGEGRASSSIKLKIGGSIPPVLQSSASRGVPPTLLPEAAALARVKDLNPDQRFLL